jgi:hypothetical protein
LHQILAPGRRSGKINSRGAPTMKAFPLPLTWMALALVPPAAAQQHVWHADLQVRSLTVTAAESDGRLTARVVVTAAQGEAIGARVEILLPVGVGIVELGPGCAPGPGAPGVPSLRARVVCTIGTLRSREVREFRVTTTAAPAGVAPRFGAMATSDTPDPNPKNNFAETGGP